jgi:hypothetical protein
MPTIRAANSKGDTLTRQKKLAITLGIALVGVATTAGADYFGDYFADNSNHTFFIAGMGPAWTTSVRAAMTQLANDTDMTRDEVSSHTDAVDVVFANGDYGDTTWCGRYSCIDWRSPKCFHSHININTRNNNGCPTDYSAFQKKYVLCHEIGHSIGFNHEPSDRGTCMAEDWQWAVLSTHDKNHVNNHY